MCDKEQCTVPCGWSFPLWSADPTIWTWQWPVYMHTCKDNLASARSEGTHQRKTEVINNSCHQAMNKPDGVVVHGRYLPIGTQRSSARPGRVEKGGVFFWLVVLKEKELKCSNSCCRQIKIVGRKHFFFCFSGDSLWKQSIVMKKGNGLCVTAALKGWPFREGNPVHRVNKARKSQTQWDHLIISKLAWHSLTSPVKFEKV